MFHASKVLGRTMHSSVRLWGISMAVAGMFILCLIGLPAHLRYPAALAGLTVSLSLSIALLYRAYKRNESVDAEVDLLRGRLRQLQQFTDELIETDTTLQNDLVQTNAVLNQRVFRLTSLLNVSKRLVTTYELENVLQQIANLAREIMDCDEAVLATTDGRGEDMIVKSRAAEGSADAPEQLSTPDGQHFQLSAPLRLRDLEIGTLRVYTKRVNSGTPEDMQILSVLATFAAIAIENARLYSSLTKVNQDLASLKDYNEGIIESVPGGVVALDPSLRISTWNSAMERITGVPRLAVLGRDFFDVFCELRHTSLYGLITKVLSEGGIEELRNIPMRAEGGTEFTGSIKTTSLHSPEQKVSGAILTIEDVTEKVRMGEHLRQVERLKIVGEFAAGMAHEINNPIGVISACAEYLAAKLEREMPNPGPYVKRLKVIEDEAIRCSSIVRSLLVFARQSEFNPTPVDLSKTLDDTLVLVIPRARKQGVDVRLVCPQLPKVVADEQQLKQVFLNLILNALEASASGGVVTIKASYAEADSVDSSVLSQLSPVGGGELTGVVEVDVIDNGSGIQPEDLQRIFRPFFTTKSHGTGLGLSISHGIIERHGGSIAVKSTPSQSTTFTVRLPVV